MTTLTFDKAQDDNKGCQTEPVEATHLLIIKVFLKY